MAHSFLPRVLFALLGSVPPVGSNICAIIDIGHRAFCSVSSKSHSRQCHNLPADELRVQLGSSSIIKWIDAPLPLPGVLFQTHPLPGVCIEEELESEPSCSNRVFPEKKNLDGRESSHASIPKKSKPYPDPVQIEETSISLPYKIQVHQPMYAIFEIVSSSLLKENLPSHMVTQTAYMVNKVLARAKKKGNEDCKDV